MADWPNLYLGPGPTITPWHPESIGAREGMNPTSAVWPSANRAIFIPFRLWHPITARLLFVHNGAAVNGNLDVGLYDPDGNRLVSSGSTAQAGINVIQTLNIADTQLGPGWFYMAMAMDNIVGAVLRRAPSISIGKLLGLAMQDAAFPLPNPAAIIALNTAAAYYPFIGLCTRAVM